jgi:hypothetical protein
MTFGLPTPTDNVRRDGLVSFATNETRRSAPGLLNIHFVQKCCNSQLIRVAFTPRRRCEDTRGQLCLHGGYSLSLGQDDLRLI